MNDFDIKTIGLSVRAEKLLESLDVRTVQGLVKDWTVSKLLKIPGVGRVTVRNIQDRVRTTGNTLPI